MTDDTLPVVENGEPEMVAIQCAECSQGADLNFTLNHIAVRSHYPEQLEFRGVVTCQKDKHKWPVTIMTDNLLQSTDQHMPVSESNNLSSKVPPALVLDVQDAENTHFAQVFRASVVMCRRALQLGFQEPPHSIPDGPYGRMLEKLVALPSQPLSTATQGLAIGIGDYGGIGAHNPKAVTMEEARVTIFTTVRVLNELFPE